MSRFYINVELYPNQELELPAGAVRHVQVLRLRVGEEVVLFNGNGRAYPAVLDEITKKSVRARVLREEESDKESPLDITLVQAVSSGERMDFTLQKSVELGVKRIIPLASSRSIVKLSGERAQKKVERWQEVVVSACEQSGRNIVPQVLPVMGFADMLQCLSENEVKLLLGLKHAKRLDEAADKPQKIAFMVGPEGGWTEQEEAAALAAGFRPVLLGKRILRTETAALAAIAAMQTLWGDFV